MSDSNMAETSGKKKLAIIGASHFQNPLILKAKEMGLETHVFAWECGDVGEETADFFHPISIMETQAILSKCREIGIDGIATIGSDLANITVAHVANAMRLQGNSLSCVKNSTDKHAMRQVFADNGDPSPMSAIVSEPVSEVPEGFSLPLIVKPTDRSGSRGITKVTDMAQLPSAIAAALDESFAKQALVEEFVEGREFSVEGISWQGEHSILSITEKFTTGAPSFIETGHLEPARLLPGEAERIEAVVADALTHLGVECGASHSEVKVDPVGSVKIIEIGSRMGGDHIGSDLVRLSTGYDFLEAVVRVALGQEPARAPRGASKAAAIRFAFSQDDLDTLDRMREDAPGLIDYVSPMQEMDHEITDSSSRYGYFIFSGASLDDVEPYLPS